jgi:hypothetical protein
MKQIRPEKVGDLFDFYGVSLKPRRYHEGKMIPSCGCHSGDAQVIVNAWGTKLDKYLVIGTMAIFIFKLKNGKYSAFKLNLGTTYGYQLERIRDIETAFEKMQQLKQFDFEPYESTADAELEAYLIAAQMEAK